MSNKVKTRRRASKSKRRHGPGRPKGPPSTAVLVRFLPDQIAVLDNWIKKQDEKIGRPKAIRAAVEKAYG